MPETITDPGLVIGQWFPATVRVTWPEPRVYRRARVYVTTRFVIIYTKRPAAGSEMPDWFATIDLAQTNRPIAGLPNAGAGIDLVTEQAGLVTLTPEGGCGCSNPLKAWQPSWASATTPWPGR